MRQRILTITILIGFLSCEQKQVSTEKQSDTLKAIPKDTIRIKTVPKDTIGKIKPVSIPQNCTYENVPSDLGIGVVMAPSTFEIFNDSLLTEKFSTINMYADEDKINFCSMFYKPDYGIMHFACIAENTNSYKVVTGNFDYKFLPKGRRYEFKTWEKYILESFGLRRKIEHDPKQVLRKEPLDDSEALTIPGGHELFCPMEMKGDWLKVKYDCFYNKENNPHEGEPCYNYIDNCEKPLTGWLKWRTKNELMIGIFLMP